MKTQICLIAMGIYCLTFAPAARAVPPPVSAYTGSSFGAFAHPPQGRISLSLPESHSAVFLDNGGNDSREPMTNLAFPWSAIGRLYRDNGDGTSSRCTGTLVGRSVVLTAAHCMLKNGAIVGSLFQANYVDGVYQGESTTGWITVGTTDPDTYRNSDWAVVQLASPLGDAQSWLGVETFANLTLPLKVQYAGYSNNFSHGDTAGADTCFVRESLSNGTYGHDCSMGAGGSGGPLFFKDGNNVTHVVAVNTRGINGGVYSQYTTAVANIAVMSQDLLNLVIEYKNKYDN